MSKKLAALIMFLLFSTGLVMSHAAQAQSIRWQEWSTSAFKEAQREHKLILIYGGVTWCHWCQQMESSSFQDPAVVLAIREHFIPIHINVEESQSLAHRYGIEGFPTILIVDAENRILKKHAGYIGSSGLLRMLKEFD